MRRPEFHRFSETLTLLLLAGTCYVFFFHGLGRIGLLGPDEPRYSSVAREMYQSGDYVTPRLHGVPWFEKPVLLYWSEAASFALFGIGEFAARFPSALAATVTVFFIYFVCRKIWGLGTALWASLILASSTGFLAFGRAASTDMLLTACLTIALFSFLMGYNARGRSRRWWFLAFYVAIGFGVLAKGPVALALPAISLVGFLLFRGRRNEWMEWYPLYAVVVLVIAAPWYIAVTRANGWEFIQVFFVSHNLERFASTVHGHERPFYFYLPALVMLTLPWTFMLVPALRRTLDRNDQLMVWFGIVPMVFFSVAGSKLPGYILPSVPPIALLCARVISKVSSGAFRIAAFLEAGILVLIGVAFGFFGPMLNVDPHVNGLVITAVIVPMAAMVLIVGRWLRPVLLGVINTVAMGLIVLSAVNFVLPRFETTDTMRPWQSALQELVPDDQIVFMYRPTRWMEYGLQFYRPHKAEGVFTQEDLDSALKTAPRVLFVADDKGLTDLSALSGIDVQIVKTVGAQSAFWAWRTQ
jgi:4-amino-4-deoxy-L-arabinose transferase-like glycosyltransferase